MLLLSLIIMALGPVGYESKEMCPPDQYYCHSSSSCQHRCYRCTILEYCLYKETTDGCFRNDVAPEAYNLVLGEMKRLRSLNISGLTNKFILYKGFLYEYSRERRRVIVHDANDPHFKYGYYNWENWSEDDRELKKVGWSFCKWEDAQYFVEQWNNLYVRRLELNCLQFTKAFHWFLTVGVCVSYMHMGEEDHDAVDEHTQTIINYFMRKCSI